mgnify:CR=1 FL=1
MIQINCTSSIETLQTHRQALLTFLFIIKLLITNKKKENKKKTTNELPSQAEQFISFLTIRYFYGTR